MTMPRMLSKLSSMLVAAALLAPGLLPEPAWGEPGPKTRDAAALSEQAPTARVIVKYKTDSTLMRALAVDGRARPLHAQHLAKRLGLALTDGRVLGPRTQGLRATGVSSAQLAARLAAQPDVEWAVPDRRRFATALPNDPFLRAGQPNPFTPAAGQWYLRAPDATFVSAINAVGAWEITRGSPGITVAVLDTGVRFDHPELAAAPGRPAKLHPGYDFVQSVKDRDGDGRDADASDPGDWTTAQDGCGPAEDSVWHGTQMAGLIGAATNDGVGMAGVGYDVMVLPVRVLGRCGGFDSDIIAGMRWAAGVSSDVGVGTVVTVHNPHPAKVVNLSLGSAGACEASYRDAVAELNAFGVAVVAAAGNQNGLAVNTPANCPGAIAVAGVRHVGSKVGYSSIGPEVTIAAPAGNCVNEAGQASCLYPILTTSNTGLTVPAASSYTDGYNTSLGTSFSTAQVAGTIALVLSLNPALKPHAIKSLLQSSARAFPSSGGDAGTTSCRAPDEVEQAECYCTTSTCGAGMLDAARAVALAFNPSADVSASSTTPGAGTPVTLDGSGSLAYAGRTITGYQWAIIANGSDAAFSGPTNTAMVTLNATRPGTVTVQLSVTDSSGATGVDSIVIDVVAPVSSGGGGGAIDLVWLLALALAAALARRYAGARAVQRSRAGAGSSR